MSPIISYTILAACALLCASQPVEKLPVLRSLPHEVLFRLNKEFVIDCATEGKEPGIKYKWYRNGKPIEPNSGIVQSENEGTLVFKDPVITDSAIYQCIAETPLGTATAKPVKVSPAYMDNPEVTLQKHKPVEGKTYKLDCKIPYSYPKPEISWILESPKSRDNVKGARFTISDQGDLYFANVTKEDTENRKYICVAKSPAFDGEVVLAEHVLEGVVPSKDGDHEVVQQYVTRDVTLYAGESVYLYCIYGGNPLAHPDWYKDDVNVNNSPQDRVTRYNKSVGKRLLIKEVQLEDQGAYTCVIDNEVGRPQKHTFKVEVVSAPKLVEKPESKMIVKEGQDVTITCKVEAVPEPDIEWTKDLENQDKKTNVQLHTETKGAVTVTDLTIKNIKKSNTGYYGCNATNIYGSTYAETLVYVQ